MGPAGPIGGVGPGVSISNFVRADFFRSTNLKGKFAVRSHCVKMASRE